MTQELDYIDQGEDFTELEALINPKPTPDAQDDEGFDELEALLGEAMADRKTTEAVKHL